jgi:hypothetical protein
MSIGLAPQQHRDSTRVTACRHVIDAITDHNQGQWSLLWCCLGHVCARDDAPRVRDVQKPSG